MYERSNAEKATDWVSAADMYQRFADEGGPLAGYWDEQSWFARKMAGLLEA
jgi:hypothetical protein